jgi:hypothetical protein
MTSGLELATLWLVAKHLNNLRYGVTIDKRVRTRIFFYFFADLHES